MKTFLEKLLPVAFLALLAGGTLACGDDDGDGNGSADASATIDADTAWICDPEGPTPEMGELLNAPVEGDVEVIVKEPQHPGDPGPQNLP